jgi:hypothetical protein
MHGFMILGGAVLLVLVARMLARGHWERFD